MKLFGFCFMSPWSITQPISGAQTYGFVLADSFYKFYVQIAVSYIWFNMCKSISNLFANCIFIFACVFCMLHATRYVVYLDTTRTDIYATKKVYFWEVPRSSHGPKMKNQRSIFWKFRRVRMDPKWKTRGPFGGKSQKLALTQNEKPKVHFWEVPKSSHGL